MTRGWDNNTTALQFTYTYGAMLIHVGVVGSSSNNVLMDSSNDILTAEDDDVFAPTIFEAHSYSAHLPTLTLYVANVCSYMAGFIVRRLLPKVKCLECHALLVEVPIAANFCFL